MHALDEDVEGGGTPRFLLALFCAVLSRCKSGHRALASLKSVASISDDAEEAKDGIPAIFLKLYDAFESKQDECASFIITLARSLGCKILFGASAITSLNGKAVLEFMSSARGLEELR